MAAATAVIAGIGLAVSTAGTVYGAHKQGKAAKRAGKKAKKLQSKLEGLEKNRQKIINPFEGVFDISNMMTNTSGMLSNTYANLGVATQAAEFQAEEADIALANTLDALQASGASAGGATALAQAALQSKRGISTSIEQQEATNMKMKAQGEQNLQMAKFGEAQRVQGALVGEARRLQQADVAGREFTWGQQERREGERLNRTQAQITGAQQQQVAARESQAAIIGAGISAVGNVASSAAGNISGGGGGGGSQGPYSLSAVTPPGTTGSSGRNYTNSSDFSGFTNWSP